MRVLIFGSPTTGALRNISEDSSIKGGGWVENLVNSLLNNSSIDLHVGCFSSLVSQLQIHSIDRCTYYILPARRKKLDYCTKESINDIKKMVSSAKADVVHIIGTERDYDYQIAKIAGFSKCIVSVTGLVGFCAEHYYANLDRKDFFMPSIGDILRGTSIAKQKKQFEKWGKYERQLIREVKYIFGRTTWDRYCIDLLNPITKYVYCGEVLNPVFYESKWEIGNVTRHSIFLTQATYPLKGVHIFLKAFSIILKKYKDATLVIAGPNTIRRNSLQESITATTYSNILRKTIKKLNIPEESILFSGPLSSEEMARQYLSSHVFCSPSSIENSSNSIGEAMLVGVPTVASYVGGNSSLIHDKVDGMLYPYDEYYILAQIIQDIFNNDDLANTLSKEARKSAACRYSIDAIVHSTLEGYNCVYQESEKCNNEINR